MNPNQSWLAACRLADLNPSAPARSWLTERGSLTARLRRHWPDLAVELQGEAQQRPWPCELDRLGLATDSLAWVRSVTLHQAGQALVQARSVIPAWSQTNPWQEIERLGCRPLGELLFQQTDLERSDFEFARTPSGWARRCVFRRQGAPLLLTEYFLAWL